MTAENFAMAVESMRELLAKEYGIYSDADLDRAIREMEPLDITLMVASPVPEKQKKERAKNAKPAKRTAGRG